MSYRKATLAVTALGLLPAMACSNTIAVRRPVTPPTAQKVLSEVADRRVEMALVPSGSAAGTPDRHAGYLLGANAGAFVFREDQGVPTPSPTEIPFERTQAITYKRPGAGALEGALIGVLPGLLTGLVFGSALESMQCSSDTEQRGECKSYAPQWGLGLGAFTALVGAAIGAAIGHRTTYTFSQ